MPSLKARFDMGPKDFGAFMGVVGFVYACSQFVVAKPVIAWSAARGEWAPSSRVERDSGASGHSAGVSDCGTLQRSAACSGAGAAALFADGRTASSVSAQAADPSAGVASQGTPELGAGRARAGDVFVPVSTLMAAAHERARATTLHARNARRSATEQRSVSR